MSELRFNHVYCENDGTIRISLLPEKGRVRYVTLSGRELATLLTDIGVVLTARENLKLMAKGAGE